MKLAGTLLVSLVALTCVATESQACDHMRPASAKEVARIQRWNNAKFEPAPPGCQKPPLMQQMTPSAMFYKAKSNKKYVSINKYIWQAPSKEDKKIRQEIEKAQIDYGVGSKEAADVMLKHAKNYNLAKQYQKAKNLTDELLKANRAFNGIPGISLRDIYNVRGVAVMNLKRPHMIQTTVYPRPVHTTSRPMQDSKGMLLRKVAIKPN